MSPPQAWHPLRSLFWHLLGLVLISLVVHPQAGATAHVEPADLTFPFREGDRIAWIGSSSKKIGVWPRTMEFLLRTRHPPLNLRFHKFGSGGGTFATGLEHLDRWLDESRPTLVFFNFGANDASAGEAGLERFKGQMEHCVTRAERAGARVVLMTSQASDVRKSGKEPAALRRRYAEAIKVWNGKGLDRIGRTRWVFEVRKQAGKGVVDEAPRLPGATRRE